MNGQTEQLQSLIGEIDGVLSKATPNLPWVMAGGTAEQRQLLERVRSYLLTQQQGQDMNTHGLLGNRFNQTEHGVSHAVSVDSQQQDSLQQQVSQQILQAVMQELGYLRVGLTQPIQADLERLQHQRAALLEEVRQLELRRQYHLQTQASPTLPVEAVQVLVAQLQAVLAQSGAMMPLLGSNMMHGQALPEDPMASGVMVGNADSSISPHDPQSSYAAQQLQQLQALQTQSDRLLMNLDTTLRIVCDSLQRNLQTYEESLSQGLAKMHSLGQQGEMMFTAWMNFLVQRLGQESADYLQASYPSPNWETTNSASHSARPDEQKSLGRPTIANTLTPQTKRVLEQLGIKPPVIDLPYPGTEVPATLTDSFSMGNSRFNLEDMDLEDLDLSDLSFSPSSSSSLDVLDEALNDLDALNALDNADHQELSSQLEMVGIEAKPTEGSGALATGDEDLNSALEFLEQLSAALQEQSSEPLQTTPDSDLASEAYDSALAAIVDQPMAKPVDKLDDLLISEDTTDDSVINLPSAQESARDIVSEAASPSEGGVGGGHDNHELDDFYNSLFGAGNAPSALDFDSEHDRAEINPLTKTQEVAAIPDSSTGSDIANLDAGMLADGVNASLVEMLIVAPSTIQPVNCDLTEDDLSDSNLTDSNLTDGNLTDNIIAGSVSDVPDGDVADSVLTEHDLVEPDVIEPEIVDVDVSLRSDGVLTLESSDLFPGVDLFSEQDLFSGQFGSEQFGLEQFGQTIEDPDVADSFQDGMDDPNSLENVGLVDGDVALDDRPLLTLDDLFRAEDPEPSPTLIPPRSIVTSETISPEIGVNLTRLDPISAIPSIDPTDGNDLASLEEFLGSSLSVDRPPVSGINLETQPIQSVQASPSDPSLGISDDGYIPASPDETLLVVKTTVEGDDVATQDVDFWLNASVLRQLSDDLSNLEHTQPADDAWEGLTFDDPVFTNPEDNPTSEPAGFQESPPAISATISPTISPTIIEQPTIAPSSDAYAPTDTIDSERLGTLFEALVPPTEPPAIEQDDFTPDSLEAMFADVPTITDEVENQPQYPIADSLGTAIATPYIDAEVVIDPVTRLPVTNSLVPNPADELLADLLMGDPISTQPTLELPVSPPPPLLESASLDPQAEGTTLNDMFADFSDVEDSQKKKIDPSFLITPHRSDTASIPAVMPPVLELISNAPEPAIATSSDTVLQTNSNTVLQTNTVLQPPDHDGLPDRSSPGTWYLGLDIGTTGISAVLFNRAVGKLYPIGWQTSDFPEVAQSSRLPAISYIPNTVDGDPQAVGSQAEALQAFMQDAYGADRTGILLQHFKPYLKVALPYQSTTDGSYQPTLCWSTQTKVPLVSIQRTLQVLLMTLVDDQSSQVSALGLDTSALRKAMATLSGVILGYPHNWSDTYSVNLRDVVLRSGLVQHPDQVIFIEETIAAVLSGLPASRDVLRTISKRHRAQKDTNWRGSTLVINAGATTTELSVVFLPDQVQELAHNDFSIRSIAYAGNALDQDIVARVLYPAWIEQQTLTIAQAQLREQNLREQNLREQIVAGDLRSDFTIPNPDGSWDALGFTAADLPTPGDPDVSRRQALQQRLESSTLGKLLLEAARYIKLALQYRNSVVLTIGGSTCVVHRRQLESEVFLPFVKRLNEGLKELLEQTGFIPQTINQVICTGGTASLPAIARWLRQKLPNATIIQDTYAPDQVLPQLLPTGVAHFTPIAPLCSRVAYGLAVLPLYPNVIDLPRQQYGDYFLLSELLRLVEDSERAGAETMPPTFSLNDMPTFSLNDIMQRLATRAIDTHACQHRIMALLEGHLPPGLIPSPNDWALFSSESLRYPACQQLLAAPLFTQHYEAAIGQVYRADVTQCRIVREFLETVVMASYQTLERPLVVALGAVVQ